MKYSLLESSMPKPRWLVLIKDFCLDWSVPGYRWYGPGQSWAGPCCCSRWWPGRPSHHRPRVKPKGKKDISRADYATEVREGNKGRQSEGRGRL